ncbi:hypothetical protein [Streptomyces subrutilus]|uniref:hypothetical protein n=1 Tax=Streptomyces subrutilus TaxID=36818 RepID=UPI00326499D0
MPVHPAGARGGPGHRDRLHASTLRPTGRHAATGFDSRPIAPFELYVQAGRDERLRAAAAECFAAYDLLATRIPTQLGVPDPERLAGAAVAPVFGQQLRQATGAPAEDPVATLLVLTKFAPAQTP